MMIRKVFLVSFAVSLAFLIGCSDSVEEPDLDCTQSDLAVSVASSTEPNCSTAGSITVAGSGGTAPYEFSIDGTSFQSSTTFSDISAGTYTITVQDSDGCTATVAAELIAGPDGITLNLSSTDAECGSPTGTITASATGGDGSYTFSLNGGSSQTTGDFTDIPNGAHEVEVTDGDGCSATQSVIVSSGTSWASDVMPIIDSNCAVSGCHNGDNGSIPNFTVFNTVQTGAENIKSRTGNRSMPPSTSGLTLSNDEIELIACWVDDGAQNN